MGPKEAEMREPCMKSSMAETLAVETSLFPAENIDH